MKSLDYFIKMFRSTLIIIPFCIILLTSISSPLFSQRIWQRLESMHNFQPEDIVLTSLGNVYMAVLGQNIILESSDQGKSWRNIVNDTFKYNPFNTQKELYVDHQDSLVEFLHSSGFLLPRYYDGTTFYLDPLLFQNLNAWKGINGNVKYDNEGSYFFIDNPTELKKYSKRWFESKKIFNNGNKIRNYYVYKDSINYIITDINSTYEIFKFNSLTGKSRLLTNGPPVSYSNDILITESGKVLTPTVSGLYLSTNEGLSFKLIKFDSLVNSRAQIHSLRFTLTGNILMLAGKDYYYSTDEGDHWNKLVAFNREIPDYFLIEKLEVLDSQFAVMIIKDKCELKRTYLLSPLTKAWSPIEANISVLNMSNVFKDKIKRLYARDHLCDVVFSDDESKTWDTYYIDGKILQEIIPAKSGSLFGITKIENMLYKTIDNGSNWTLISDIDLGIPTIEIIGINPLFDQTLLIVGGIRDPGTVAYKEYFYLITQDNGESWKLLPKETYPFIQTIVWNGQGKLYSYGFKKKEVYSSLDLGQSWNVDHTFDGFDEIYTISFNNNGGLVIQGVYFGVRNVFVSFDGINFMPANGNYFNQTFVGFSEISYPNIVAIAGTKGVYLSNDGGLNWEDVTSGITIYDSVVTLINSFYVDERNFAYLSIQYDGLYKSINPLVVSDKQINKRSDLVFYPNPFKDYLFIKCLSCNQDENIIEIFNSLGKLVMRELINKDLMKLHFSQELPPGLYTYKLMRSWGFYDSGTIFKLND